MSSAQNQFFRLIALTIAVVLVCGPALLARQDKISPVSDYQYKRDYAQVETIMKEADLQKRGSLLLAFVKEHPITRSLDYVAQNYIACMKPFMDAKDWAKVVSQEEAFVAVMPTADSVKAAQVPEPGAGEFLKNQLHNAHKVMQQGLLAAYFQSNNMAKAAEVAEKAYAADPSDKQMLAALMEIYKRSNPEKYVALTEKLAADAPIEQSFGTIMQLADTYAQKGNLEKAVEYSNKVMQAFGDKVPQGVQEADWNNVRARAYGYMAASAYAKKDYPQAIDLYGRVSRFAPKSDTPYYYIGMSKWNSKDQVGAIESFAKAVVLGKENAKKAQTYMEQLYKAQHNDSLDGLDQVLAKAKADLGIS